MQGIKDRVAIIGMGCTKFGELWDKSGQDLIIEAAYEAFEDAGIEPKDIQAAWVGTATEVTGGFLSAPLKLGGIPVSRVENACGSGTDTFRNACYAVAAGIYDIVLALGVEKLKDAGVGLTGAHGGLGGSEVELPSLGMIMFSLAATRYFHHYKINYDEGKRMLAKIAVKNHFNGSLNSRAHLRRKVSIEQVVNAPILAWPLGLYDCCTVSDGAAAAIITRTDLANNFRDDYVLVKSIAVACGKGRATLCEDYDYVHFDENLAAAKIAYEEAGLQNPRKEISIAAIHDCFTINELITMEDLGFSPRTKAKDDVESGFFELNGELPVNTDGGLKCFGHPIGATGLRMIFEIYKQLQGKAGEHQIKNPTLGLTHNLGGMQIGAFTSAMTILSCRD